MKMVDITEAFKSNSNLKSESFFISLGGSARQSERFVISRSRVQTPPGASIKMFITCLTL